MNSKTKNLNTERKYLYKLLDSFNEKELYSVKKFVEFVEISKKNNDDKLLQILMDAPNNEHELNLKTIKDIKKARTEFKKGKTYSHSRLKQELGI